MAVPTHGRVPAYTRGVEIRPFRDSDAASIVRLAAACARGEADFVLHPLWESEAELYAEFERHGIEPEEHLLVADAGDGTSLGTTGLLRFPGATVAALIPPVVVRSARGKGAGGELLRGALELAKRVDVKLASAAIGSRNRSGYALLAAHGFRPVRQHFYMRCDRTLAAARALPAGVVLDSAGSADLPAIHGLYVEADFPTRTVEASQRALLDGRHAHAVARRGREVVGFVELDTHWPERPFVSFVGVESSLRDRGVGTGLVSWALAREFERGARSALLLLSPANRSALRAYEKVGFRRHRMVDVLEKGL
jgi:ribosomal protein S18 acetylase RimI-like enzyme